jgi:hypothetical protein
MPVLYAYIPKKTTQLEQVQRRAARYVTNRYHNTSIVSSIIEHLDRRTDARMNETADLNDSTVTLHSVQEETVLVLYCSQKERLLSVL